MCTCGFASPAVFTAHDLLPRRTAGKRDLWRRLLERFDRVVVHSERGRETLAELGIDARVIPHPVYPSAATRADDGRTLLSLGVIRPYKGLPDAIEVTRRIPEARLLVAGDPAMPLDGTCERRAGRVAARLPAAGGARPRASRRRRSPSSRTAPSSTSRARCCRRSAPACRRSSTTSPVSASRSARSARARSCRPATSTRSPRPCATLLGDADALARRGPAPTRARRELTWDASAAQHLDLYRELADLPPLAVRRRDRRAARPVPARAPRRARRRRDERFEQYNAAEPRRGGGAVRRLRRRGRDRHRAPRRPARPLRADARRPRRRTCASSTERSRSGCPSSRSRSRIGSDVERIEDYALSATCRPRRSSVARARSTGSASRASTRAPASARCSARREHGRWLIAPDERRARDLAPLPRGHARSSRPSGRRRPGRVRVIDFMPPRGNAPDIVRIVEGLEGRVEMRTELVDPLRLRLGRPVGAAARRRDAARGRRPGRLTAAHAGRPRAEGHDARRATSPCERASACRSSLTWFPSTRAAPDAGRRRSRRFATPSASGASGCGGCALPRRLPGGGAHAR